MTSATDSKSTVVEVSRQQIDELIRIDAEWFHGIEQPVPRTYHERGLHRDPRDWLNDWSEFYCANLVEPRIRKTLIVLGNQHRAGAIAREFVSRRLKDLTAAISAGMNARVLIDDVASDLRTAILKG